MNELVFEYIKSKVKDTDNMSLYRDIIMYKDKSIEEYLIHNDTINRMDDSILDMIDGYECFNFIMVLKNVNLKNVNILKRYISDIFEEINYSYNQYFFIYESVMNYDCIEDLYDLYEDHKDSKELCKNILRYRTKPLTSSFLYKIIKKISLHDTVIESCLNKGKVSKEIYNKFLNFNEMITKEVVDTMVTKNQKINLDENDLDFFIKYLPIEYMINHYNIPFNIIKKNILYINNNENILKKLFMCQNIPFSFIKDYVPEDSLYLPLAYSNNIEEKFFEKNIKKIYSNNKYQFEFILKYANLSKYKNYILHLLDLGYTKEVFKNLSYNAKLNRLNNIDFLINKKYFQYLLKFNLYPYIKHKICFNESILYNLNKDY